MSTSQMIIADFEVVDSAVWAFLRRNFPAAFTREVLTVVNTQYVIFPDHKNRNEYIGAIEARKTPGGVLLEFWEPFVKKPDWTSEEYHAQAAAFQAAVARHKPDDFDADDREQYEALDTAVKNDWQYLMVNLDIEARINREWLDRYAEYEAMMQAAVDGLNSWLIDQGILENLPQLPSRQADLQKWKQVWKIIKPSIMQDKATAKDIIRDARIMDKLRELPNSTKTLQGIINAGEAGLLD